MEIVGLEGDKKRIRHTLRGTKECHGEWRRKDTIAHTKRPTGRITTLRLLDGKEVRKRFDIQAICKFRSSKERFKNIYVNSESLLWVGSDLKQNVILTIVCVVVSLMTHVKNNQMKLVHYKNKISH